jgi:hypothetical protein
MRFLILLALCSCAREPEWSKSSARALGDDTIAGAPVKLPRFATPPVLDGKLDDAVWANAATLGPFVDTFSGAVAEKHPVATFARAGWDDKNLYLAFVVRDRAPSSPFGRDDADPHIWGKSSGVEIMLQPGDPNDNRDYYEIQVDVGNAVFDSHWEDYMTPVSGSGADKIFGHMDWSSHVERASYVMSGHFWSVEIALPWSSLATGRVAIPPRPGDVWRMNLYSFRDGQRLALGWSPIRGQGNFHKSARWGRVQF